MELEELMQEAVQHLESDFYKQDFKFSYSSLNKLLWNPAVFYQLYVMGNKDEKTAPHLVQGKVIHALLLEEHLFEEQFIISPATLPTGNIKLVLDKVFDLYTANKESYEAAGVDNLTNMQDEILDAMKEINYHQSLKTDQQRLDKVLTAEAYSYWEFLKKKGNKTLIDQESYEFCKNAVDLIKVDQKICKLIACTPNDFQNLTVLNEQPLECKLVDRPFGLKGIIDNLVIDHDQKVIFINDIKTSGKDLKDFKESIQYYDYWMQAAIYYHLVVTHYQQLIAQGYQVSFHFIVIDRSFMVYPFLVSTATMIEWTERLHETLDKADWHYTNRDFTLPHEFATGQVVL